MADMGNGNSLRRMSAAEKRAEVVRLRGLGKSWSVIAAMVGYSDGPHALRAFNQAVAETPAPNITQVRAESRARLDDAIQQLSDVIANPPPITSAAGKIVRDDDGNPVPDKSATIRALSEFRKMDESYRKLVGADAKTERQISYTQAQEEAVRWIAQFKEATRYVDGEVIPPAIER